MLKWVDVIMKLVHQLVGNKKWLDLQKQKEAHLNIGLPTGAHLIEI